MHTVFASINRRRQWHQLPFPISLLNLLSLRLDLREKNLFDSDKQIQEHGTEEPPPEALGAPRPDGKWNDRPLRPRAPRAVARSGEAAALHARSVRDPVRHPAARVTTV
jgi:hypothetical protein